MAGLIDRLAHHAEAMPERAAFVFEGVATSFAAFERHTNQIAQALLADGFMPGERVAYVGRNTTAFFELLYGAMKAGVVVAPINWRLATPEILAIIADCGARLVVLGREFAGEAAYSGLRGVEQVLAAEMGAAGGLAVLADWHALHFARPSDHLVSPGDVAVQLYTSGTTGLPKGVMLSHANILAGLEASLDHDLGWNRWSAEDSALLAMPVSHVSGTGWGMIAVHHGATCHVQRQFDVEAAFDTLAEYRFTRLFLVPAALQMLVRHGRAPAADFSSLHEVCYGASPMPRPLLLECMGVMKTRFVQFYGMTETAGTIVAMPDSDHAAAIADPDQAYRLRAAGRALPWVSLRIVDVEGRDVAEGEVGELWVAGAACMLGYWQKPEETRRTIDAQGWLRTGDAGYAGADGLVFIHDRVKDMIVSGGENVYPAEVESALGEHPAVAEVAVIGVPDARWGEAVKAIVVLRPDAVLEAAALIIWARARIAGFKCPGSVDFVEVLPRNGAGKLLKRQLRAPYWEGMGRQVG